MLRQLSLCRYNQRRDIFSILLCLVSFVSSFGQTASARLDSNQVLIGDHIVLNLTVEYGVNEHLVSIEPNQPIDTSQFEIINEGQWESGAPRGLMGKRRTITFTAWDTGMFTIPSVRFTVVQANGTNRLIETQPLLLTVQNPKGAENMAAPIGIKDIVREEWTIEDIMPWVLAAVMLSALGLGGWFLYKNRQKRLLPPTIQTIRQPPHIIALGQLQDLQKKNYIEKGAIKTYYSELSHILRGYFEDRFKIPALEITTDELMALLTDGKVSHFQPSDNILEDIQDLLTTADLVKFAKVQPPAEVHTRFWAMAVNIVEATKPQMINEALKIAEKQ